jgi:hypothetical protein
MVATTPSSPLRRFFLEHLLSAGGVIFLTTAGISGTVLAARSCDEDGEAVGSLDLQRAEGWDVGSTSSIEIPSAVLSDSAGSSNWALQLTSLGDDLAPSDPQLLPLHVLTLFDVLRDERSTSLARTLKPMNTWDMGQAALAAQGLADLYEDAKQRKITALVLDLPGPESVAAAASLSRLFTPVFLFDNWPHPLGVVPSHLTLAAAIYNRPEFVAAARSREPLAPPVFVLDSNRMLPYRDESNRFDNRYFARMPTAATLTQLGVQRILYVTATKQENEQDDLNEDFVNYANANIDVKMISLYEFEAVQEEPAESNSHGHPRYRYHGHSGVRARSAFYSSYYRTPSNVGGPLGFEEPFERRSPGAGYSPKPRNTPFHLGRLSGDALHFEKSTPNYFGRPSPTSHVSRSGSMGRVGSHSFG